MCAVAAGVIMDRVRDITAASCRAELCLLAARFVLPGLGPRVDKAIEVACDLLTLGLDTRATVDVAGLGYGTPFRDAESLIRDMLIEQHVPVPEPGAGEAVKFRVVLRAFGAGALDVGEFAAVFYARLPAWDQQDKTERRLVVLLDNWEHEATADGRAGTAAAMRQVAKSASGQ